MLALLSTDSNKLLMQWKSPYEIVENQGKVIYTIDMNGKVKTFMLICLSCIMTDDCGVDAIILVVASVVMMDVQEDNAVNDKCLLYSLFKIQKETPSEVVVSDD